MLALSRTSNFFGTHCSLKNVMRHSSDALCGNTCVTLDGRTERIQAGKHNGIRTAFLPPVWADGGPVPRLACPWADESRYYVNLNETERRIWRQVLLARPIAEIARNEGVTRPAIYSRLLGKRGRGGMIEKSYWVLLWCIGRGLHPPGNRRAARWTGTKRPY